MSFIAAAIIGGAAIGGAATYFAGKEAKKGAEKSADAQRYGIDVNREIYEQTREDFTPYREFGYEGLEGYMSGMKDPSAYKQSPGYMFRLKEGLKAIGIPDGGSKYLSGPQLKASTQYAQDYATSDYDRYLSRYGAMIDVGRGANTATAGAGAQFGAQTTAGMAGVGQSYQNAANARASSYMGMGNAANQGVQNYMMYNMMNKGAYTGGPAVARPGVDY